MNPHVSNVVSADSPFSRPQLRIALEAAVPLWIAGRRWFGAKSRTIVGVRTEHIVPLQGQQGSTRAGDAGEHLALAYLKLSYQDGSHELYQLALSARVLDPSIAPESATAEDRRAAIITSLPDGGVTILLSDASNDESFRQTLLHLVESGGTVAGSGFTLHARASPARPERPAAGLQGRTGSAEQSNTNFLFGDALLLKLFRRLEPGIQPDVEIGRFLTEQAHFDHVPPFFGELSLSTEAGAVYATAILQGLVANVGDGWGWTLERLAEWLTASEQQGRPFASAQAGQQAGRPAASPEDLAAAALLGRRTAEMHLALATPTTDPAFAAEPFTPAETVQEDARVRAQMERTFDALKRTVAASSGQAGRAGQDAPRLPSPAREQAEALLAVQDALLNPSRSSLPRPASGLRIRIHGDYHLGQVLRTADDFVLLDFEGEPARPLEERRQKQCPLRDVAGMLRSFSYVAGAALDNAAKASGQPVANGSHKDQPPPREALAAAAGAWEQAVNEAFLKAYRTTAARHESLLPNDADFDALLELYLLEKALYELLYELNNRPLWVHIPLAGILSLSMVRAVTGAHAQHDGRIGESTWQSR